MKFGERLDGLEQGADNMRYRLVVCRPDELRPHPSYVRHHIGVSCQQTSLLVELGDSAFREPLIVTQDRIIVDGYARWEGARGLGRETLLCLEYQLTPEESLQMLIQRHRRSNGLNDFCRILLALELEPWLRKRAESNQQYGGQNKGLSKLPEAQKVVVQRQIAVTAAVSTGNVSKVKQLISKTHPELMRALRRGEIRIHRAWLWSKLPAEKQQEKLRRHRLEKGLRKTVKVLVSRLRGENSPILADQPSPTPADLDNLVKLMSKPEYSKIGPVTIALLDAPGKGIFVTKELFQSLQAHQESLPLCYAITL